MTSRLTKLLSSALTLGAFTALLVPIHASAGQFKTLNTQILGAGEQVSAFSSPKNTNIAMELETYEFQTTPSQVNWRCRILANETTRALTVRMWTCPGFVEG